MIVWAVIVAVGVGSFLFRVGPLLLLQRRSLSEEVDRLFSYAGLAAISGLIGTSVQHEAHGPAAAPTLAAIAVAGVIAARGKSMLQIILVGGGLYVAGLAVTGLVVR